MDDMTQGPPSDDPVLPPSSEPASDAAISEVGAAHPPEAVQTLKRAMRRARFDDAERAGIQAELRATQIGRLELLEDALQPLLSQVPKSIDLFDVGLMPGPTPRLFIDMIGFVEMARDARVYRFLQDTRHRRITLAESTDIPTIVDAVTDYVARRLLERDKALAADTEEPTAKVAPEAAVATTKAGRSPARHKLEPRPNTVLRWTAAAFGFLLDFLGALTLFALLAFGGWLAWNRLHGRI